MASIAELSKTKPVPLRAPLILLENLTRQSSWPAPPTHTTTTTTAAIGDLVRFARKNQEDRDPLPTLPSFWPAVSLYRVNQDNIGNFQARGLRPYDEDLVLVQEGETHIIFRLLPPQSGGTLTTADLAWIKEVSWLDIPTGRLGCKTGFQWWEFVKSISAVPDELPSEVLQSAHAAQRRRGRLRPPDVLPKDPGCQSDQPQPSQVLRPASRNVPRKQGVTRKAVPVQSVPGSKEGASSMGETLRSKAEKQNLPSRRVDSVLGFNEPEKPRPASAFPPQPCSKPPPRNIDLSAIPSWHEGEQRWVHR